MHGTLVPLFHTRMAIPNPWQLLLWAGPVVAIGVVWWITANVDRIMHFIFPNLEWEKSLGWLNIKAELRARAAIRWVGNFIYLLLAAALYAIVQLADGFPDLHDWADPAVAADLLVRVPALIICLGFWLVFLGSWLIPKLRAEREEAGLEKHRAEMKEMELERERRRPPSRIKSPLQKPRTDAPLISPSPFSPRRRDLPGG